MKLTVDEYFRGLVSWQIDSPATVQTAAGDGPWSRPLLNQAGSIAESRPLPERRIQLNPTDHSALTRPFLVRWEIIENDELVTRVWDNEHGSSTLMGVPNFGRFHRLVVEPRFLSWNDDAAFRVGDVVIRLTSRVRGEAPAPVDEIHEGNRSSFVVDVRTIELNGRYIEIIAPETQQSARDEAYTVLGLLALVLGEVAVGDVVFSEDIEQTDEGTMYGVVVARNLRMPRPVMAADEEALDRGLSLVATRGDGRKALAVGLRWYEHGIRSDSPMDRVLAFYVGLEALLGALAEARSLQSPLAEIAQDERIPELVAPLAEIHGQAAVDRLVARLRFAGPSILDMAEFYARERSLGDEFVANFRRVKGVRDPVMHGSTATVEKESADSAQDALASALRAELNLRRIDEGRLVDDTHHTAAGR